MSCVPEPEQNPAKPVDLRLRAIDNLSFIREAMERSSAFTAVPGWGSVLMGVIALAGSLLAAQRTAPLPWVRVWIGIAVVCLAVSVAAITLKSRRVQTPVLGGPTRRFALSLAPPILAGAILTEVFIRAEMCGLLPAAWLLLYGVGVVTGGAFSVRIVPVMGLCFMLLGAVLCFLPHYGGTVAWGPLTVADCFLAGGFGGLHIVFGLAIAKWHGG